MLNDKSFESYKNGRILIAFRQYTKRRSGYLTNVSIRRRHEFMKTVAYSFVYLDAVQIVNFPLVPFPR